MRNQECQALGGNLSLLCLFPKGVLPLCSGPGPRRAGTQIGSHSLPRKKRKLTHTISQTRTKPELLSGTLLGTLNIWLVSKQLLSWKITIFQRHDLRIHTEHLIFNKKKLSAYVVIHLSDGTSRNTLRQLCLGFDDIWGREIFFRNGKASTFYFILLALPQVILFIRSLEFSTFKILFWKRDGKRSLIYWFIIQIPTIAGLGQAKARGQKPGTKGRS